MSSTRLFSPTESVGDDCEWYRGQLHIHTNVHDKADIVQWYKAHGYNFAVLTDLNYATPVEGVKTLYDKPGEYITVPGIETSTYYEGTIHDVMGYGGEPATVQSDEDRSVTVPSEPASETYQRQVEMIAEAGTTPAMAHPNLTWAAGAEELLDIDPDLMRHFEMITTEPGMNDAGGGGYPSTTELWDQVLSTGRELYAIASDDSHHFDRVGPETRHFEGEMRMTAPSLPGRTSVFVYAAELSVDAVMGALDRGDFYAVRHGLTMPIEFTHLEVDESGIELGLPTGSKDIGWTTDEDNPTRYRTQFIGVRGETTDEPVDRAEVLKEDESTTPSYTFDGDELYVRARVDGSDGATAWTQPVFLDE